MGLCSVAGVIDVDELNALRAAMLELETEVLCARFGGERSRMFSPRVIHQRFGELRANALDIYGLEAAHG